jgi:hypothetical protein
LIISGEKTIENLHNKPITSSEKVADIISTECKERMTSGK